MIKNYRNFHWGKKILSFAITCMLILQEAGLSYSSQLPQNKTLLLIGQNYLQEFQDYVDATKRPAGGSVYSDIYSGELNQSSQNLVNYLAQYPGSYVELGFSWKDDLINHGYPWHRTVTIEEDIVHGKFDMEIDKIAATMRDDYPKLHFLFRIDYEVSTNFHCNTNPDAWDWNTKNCSYYVKAFNYIAHRIRTIDQVQNVQFVYHPVRGQTKLLYPNPQYKNQQGHLIDYVDWVGFSVFNHDLCVTTFENDKPVVNCPSSQEADSNLTNDLTWVINKKKKPVLISESAFQVPNAEGQTSANFINYLSRLFDLVNKYNIQALVYINSDWKNYGWTLPWGDSRVEMNPEVKNFWLAHVTGENSRYMNY